MPNGFNMGEAYFNLKRKLEELGYNSTLPVDAVPLVECIFADLLQTTRSLQHYMDLSKEALLQRDSLMMEAEPYKCDNVRLIQENNQLHRELMQLKEENLKVTRDSKRKIKSLTDELSKKETSISKLQHDIRDLSLRGLCAETLSSRNKSRRKDGGDFQVSKICICNDKTDFADKDISELNKMIQSLQDRNSEYFDEITLLKNQIEHRDSEIIRLNILLEGGRPLAALSKDFYNDQPDVKIQKLIKQVKELERANENMQKEIENSLEKQHEAMLRALGLSDKNKTLQEELHKVDRLALKVEDDCNKRLASMMNEINFLQTRIDGLTLKNSELERELSHRSSKENSAVIQKLQGSLTISLKEKDVLQREIKDLVELNKSLQDKILCLSEVNRNFNTKLKSDSEISRDSPKCLMKDELIKLFEDERRKYETYIMNIQDKLNDTMNLFKTNTNKDSRKQVSPELSSNNAFIRDLHSKLCESEQKILMLKKENDELKAKMCTQQDFNRNNYKDIINHLNTENSELSKENILLSQRLSQYKSLNINNDRGNLYKQDSQRLMAKIEDMTKEIQLLKNDKQEYHLRYKEATELVDKLKRDLIHKQNEIEQLDEENRSYKMTNRTGKASADQLRDECNFLREQIKKLQTDYINEKSLANQIKNIQLETERNSVEVQNEFITTQKKLSLSKDTIQSLEQKCKDLQSEILKLKNDKVNLIDNIKVIDKERDKLVIELDHKTEQIGVLEHNIKSQSYDINKLESEIADLKRKLNLNKVSEHKVVDYESQINFLNAEILRITQQLDTAIIENKHLQNSLADANGALQLTKIELEKSKRDVDGLKQQLQHYVAEIRRIEDLLSQKEAERSDMLEQFASLSVEANILENTNHSLESESASKSLQLQSYVNKIQNLEEKLMDKNCIIESQSARITAMSCKISQLENEIKLITEEKTILEQNVSYLKQMCSNLQANKNAVGTENCDSELKLYENRIKTLSNSKAKLESEKKELKDNLSTTETLLSNARREIVELKLALQDATTETKSLHEHLRLNTRNEDIEQNILSQEKLELPLILGETIEELSHEDDDSDHYHHERTSHSKYTHSSTL
ncbi:centrosomal protein of 135 kDa-like [Maniola hyperantus]|uniref:centrosomal protein of 135 kDa-like n=1 Tax=Aphantopus hyperantus TaxID=2795564 RepID=UPI0015690253|nr:centrosomal protein of 135 kDa-like [Maniola hyperantus]